jgi:hypothetical protein
MKLGLKSADGREAVRAIFEKRKPEFTGRQVARAMTIPGTRRTAWEKCK